VLAADLYFDVGAAIVPVQVDADRRGYVVATAETAAPCAMHLPGTHGTKDDGVATLVAAPAGHGACHVDAASLGCAASGSCPTGGTAAPAWLNIPIAPRVASRTVAPGQSSALISYLAPPLAPPPQA